MENKVRFANVVDIDDVVDRFKGYLLGFRSENTVANYVYAARMFLRQINGNLDFANKMSATRYIEYGGEDTRGEPTSRRRRKSSLVCFNNWLIEEGLVKEDFVSGIKSPKLKQRLPDALTMEEMGLLFDACMNGRHPLRNRALLEVMFCTGCRVQEIIDLKIKDIDFKRGVATVIGKGDKQRTVMISASAAKWIEQYIAEERPLIASKKSHRDTGLLFPNRNQKPLTRTQIEVLVKELATRAGIDPQKVHPHALRHTFATLMMKNGADILVISKLLGHVSISTTQIYTELDDEDKMAAFHKFFPKTDDVKKQ